MKIAIDVSPLSDKSEISHRVRGVGFYLLHLKDALLKYFPENEYEFFTRSENINNSVDLVHYPYFDPFFITLPFFDKQKRVVTVHDLTPLVFPEFFPSGIKGRIKWQLQKLSLSRSNRIITDSHASKNDIVKLAEISSDKIDVVYLAAAEEFRQIKDQRSKIKDLREKYSLPEKFVLYVGDVTWNKNLPRLIEAAIEINVPLIMVGAALVNKNFDRSNPWNQDLKKTQSLIEKNENIRAIGFVPTEDLVVLYNLATVFAMPSIYEGFGLPILEAMQSGCPVVTTREGSIVEVAGDSAFFVDAKDINSIAAGIAEVFENSKLQKTLTEKGLKNAEKFSWEKTAAQTVEVYKKVQNI